jgi:hypothetical protein
MRFYLLPHLPCMQCLPHPSSLCPSQADGWNQQIHTSHDGAGLTGKEAVCQKPQQTTKNFELKTSLVQRIVYLSAIRVFVTKTNGFIMRKSML